MKRILSLVAAAAVALSLSACAMDKNRVNDRVGTDSNGNIGVQRLSQENNYALATYKDGIYTAQGNPHSRGNEAATIEIRNGRIVDVDLSNINDKGQTGNNPIGTRMGTGRVTGDQLNSGYGLTPGTITNTPPAGNNLDSVYSIRTKLANAIIQNQSANVNIEYGDANWTGSINNWKLAVQRALTQASM